MARQVSEQYRDELAKKVRNQLTTYMDAKDIIGNAFAGQSVGNNVLQKIIFRYFGKIGEANLSARLYDPAKTKLVADNYAHWRYSSGLEARLAYEDWSILEQQGIISVGLDAIGKKIMKQLTHYFFTGEQLLEDGSRIASPNSSQYNYALDPGTGDGTLERPLENNETGNAWNSHANIRDNIETAINGYMSLNNEAIPSRFMVFYPAVARSLFHKKYSTSGDGLFSAHRIFMEQGIPEQKIVQLSNVYLPTGASGSLTAPTTADFDVYIIDQGRVKWWWTESPFVNVWYDKLQSSYPEMVIEANAAGLPLLEPFIGENTSDKFYKGVIKIDAISAS